jgi:hypothetical protein
MQSLPLLCRPARHRSAQVAEARERQWVHSIRFPDGREFSGTQRRLLCPDGLLDRFLREHRQDTAKTRRNCCKSSALEISSPQPVQSLLIEPLECVKTASTAPAPIPSAANTLLEIFESFRRELRVRTSKKTFTLTARPWQFLPSDFLLPRTRDADRNCRLRPYGH